MKKIEGGFPNVDIKNQDEIDFYKDTCPVFYYKENVKHDIWGKIQSAYIPERLYKTLTINDTLDRDAVDLSIVAIIKNEGQYIEEWVRYHIVVGVQKFYLYRTILTQMNFCILVIKV